MLELVFGFACTDSGLTGCSLSQVSKRFRAIARTSRFHSVALRSGHPTQITQFLSCFVAERVRHAESTGTLVKVLHLFLASARREIRRNHPGAREELEQYQQDVSRLIELIAPDLRTLLMLSNHIGWVDELRFPNIGLVSYPELRELSLYGYGSKFAPNWNGLNSLPSTEDLVNYPQLPNLSRLRVICDSSYLFTHNPNVRHWAERAPGLTHLCLANWKQSCAFIVATTTDVVGSFSQFTRVAE